MLKRLLISFGMLFVSVFPVRAEAPKPIPPEWTYKWLVNNGKWWTRLSSDSITLRFWYPIRFFDGHLRINLETSMTQAFSSTPCYFELATLNSCNRNIAFFQDYQKLKKRYPNTTLYTMAQNPPVMFATNQDIKTNPVLAFQDELVASTSGIYASIYYYLLDDKFKTSAISLLILLDPDEFNFYYRLRWGNIFYLSETERIYVFYRYQPQNSEHSLNAYYSSLF